MHKTASDGEVKLDGSLTQHCLEKRALNVDDDDDDDVPISNTYGEYLIKMRRGLIILVVS